MALTQAEMEARYDAGRLSPVTSYPTPVPLSAQEEEILTLLLALSEPDPDELPPTMPPNPSPLLLSLLDWAEKEIDAEYAERFAAGYKDGVAIARALQAEEQGEDIDTIIKQLERAEGSTQ